MVTRELFIRHQMTGKWRNYEHKYFHDRFELEIRW